MRNLDKARIMVRDNTFDSSNRMLQLNLFNIYNTIDKLLEKKLFSRAKVYAKYYELTGKGPNNAIIQKLMQIDIKEFRGLEETYTYNLELLEYILLLRVEDLYITNLDIMKNQPNFNNGNLYSLTSDSFSDNIDMKLAYKYLEKHRKLVKRYFKIVGYLEEVRNATN